MATPGTQPHMADSGAARAAVVNRTHRIVREQAIRMQESRKRRRSLLLPLFISSTLLFVICYAIWRVLAGEDLTPTGVPDASDQLVVVLLWSLPVTAVVLGLLFLRSRARQNNGEHAG